MNCFWGLRGFSKKIRKSGRFYSVDRFDFLQKLYKVPILPKVSARWQLAVLHVCKLEVFEHIFFFFLARVLPLNYESNWKKIALLHSFQGTNLPKKKI